MEKKAKLAAMAVAIQALRVQYTQSGDAATVRELYNMKEAYNRLQRAS
jgi:hypothetical protein